jgi:hypothetical protein
MNNTTVHIVTLETKVDESPVCQGSVQKLAYSFVRQLVATLQVP